MLKITNLTFGYSDKPLYTKVNFVVGKGQKVGLVGPNGSGKSTLLSIITGEDDGFSGKVATIGKVKLVPQEIKYDPDMEVSATVKEYLNPSKNLKNHEIQRLFFFL